MRKQQSEIVEYLTPEQIDSLTFLIKNYSALVGKKDSLIDLISLFNQLGSYNGIRSPLNQLFKFYSIEVGDRDYVVLNEPIIYGDNYKHLTFGKFFPIHFTVTSIDYDNLRMDGYIDNTYFVTGIYYSDFNYYTHIEQLTEEELKAVVSAREKFAVVNYKFSVVLDPTRLPEMLHPMNTEFGYDLL